MKIKIAQKAVSKKHECKKKYVLRVMAGSGGQIFS